MPATTHRRVHMAISAILLLTIALTSFTSVSAQSATKIYKTQPSFLYAFDTDPKANYAGGYLQSNGSSFEYTAGAGAHTGVLSFDGWQDYLDFSKFYDDNNNVLGTAMLGGEMSFEVWACWTTLDYWSRIFDFAGPAGVNDNNIFLANQWSTSTLVFESYVGSSNANSVLTYSGGVSIYSWQHIVATITKNPATTTANNAAILALYINGVQVANTTGYLPNVMARPKSWLGRSNWESLGDSRFRGLFDDFFVYNYSLSTEAITAHYVVPRVPVFELTFSVDPRINMNLVGNSLATYDWVLYDSSDSATNQYAHRGLLKLSSASSQYLDVSGDNGYSEVGTDMPVIGGSGWATADNDTQGWTFELAFKLSNVASGACLFDIGNPSSTSGAPADDHVALCINGPALTFEVSNAATGTRVTRNVVNSLFANRWYHVVVLVQPFDGAGQVGRYEAYVNGNYANSTNSGAWLRSVARSRAYIGRSAVSTAPYLDALIDNIRVFDYALTAADVRAIYRAVTFNTTTATPSFWTSAPSISHTFDVSVPWGERNGGTTLGWTSSYLGRAGIVTFTQANSEWINLLTLPDRNYNLFPGYIGGRSISFEFWVMWTVFGAYCHLMELGAVASSGGIYLDDITISTLEQDDPNGGATLKFSLESGSTGVTDATVAVPNAVYLNRWHHLVTTIDVDRSFNLTAPRSATLIVYIDGVMVGNTSTIAPRYVNRPDSWISKGRNSWDTFMGGYLDAFHYYDYEVELEQVKVHYVVPRPPLFEFVWSERPFEMPGLDWTTNYGWTSVDTRYSTAAGQSNHQGLLTLTAAAGQYVDLTVAFSQSSMGTILPQLATLPSFSTLGQSYEFPDAAGQPGRRTGMTIEASFLYTAETGANGKIFSCGVTSSPSPVDLIELGFVSGSRDLIFSASNSDTGRSNTTTVISNAFYQRWFHVVIVMRTFGQRNAVGSWQVYVNGVSSSTLQNTAFPYSTPRDICAIGRSATGASDSYFNGYIDSFRVFDYALNTTEVGRVYAAVNPLADSAVGVDPTASSSAGSSSSGLSGGAIAGIVIGVIVGVVIIVGLLMVYLRSSKGKSGGSDGGASHKHVEMSEVREEQEEGTHESDA